MFRKFLYTRVLPTNHERSKVTAEFSRTSDPRTRFAGNVGTHKIRVRLSAVLHVGGKASTRFPPRRLVRAYTVFSPKMCVFASIVKQRNIFGNFDFRQKSDIFSPCWLTSKPLSSWSSRTRIFKRKSTSLNNK